MPLLQGTELEDGRYLGLTVREVTALPHVDVFGTDTGRMGGDLREPAGGSGPTVRGVRGAGASLAVPAGERPEVPPWRRCSPRRAAPCPGERR